MLEIPGRLAGEPAVLSSAVVRARVAKLVADRAQGEPARQVHLLSPPSSVLGRDSRCDVVLAEEGVSRRHAQISARRGRYFLRDLGSLNGTYLDGERIEDEAELSSGAHVRVGRMVLRFEVSSGAEPTPAPPAASAPAALHARAGRTHAGRGSRRSRPGHARDLS
jgi:predicted component of type VI protein secretion system